MQNHRICNPDYYCKTAFELLLATLSVIYNNITTILCQSYSHFLISVCYNFIKSVVCFVSLKILCFNEAQTVLLALTINVLIFMFWFETIIHRGK